ncbi:histidine kinase [Heterostelium album PN500]|uniref:Histidine kinase n=1 Tax=Heterostelium pallidum (strain ATCC 26659 / Pp 5 / PN500) TaxID=670386 RepID=D3B2V4_HETP5|nr:histidine kinase [Heterostelium album PN500]EFA83652.1 histidine kinase [Heterostelium album PN500]|eukprot:XP_020435769.1 histidine kinase [Heterostelium album PN500]
MINLFDQGSSAYQLQQNPLIRSTRRSLDLTMLSDPAKYSVTASNMLPPMHPNSPSSVVLSGLSNGLGVINNSINISNSSSGLNGNNIAGSSLGGSNGININGSSNSNSNNNNSSNEQFSLFIYNATPNCTDDIYTPFNVETAEPTPQPTPQLTPPPPPVVNITSATTPSTTTTTTTTTTPAAAASVVATTPPSISNIASPSQNTNYFFNIAEPTSPTQYQSNSYFKNVESVEFVKELRKIVGPYCVILAISESNSPIEFSSLIDAGANDYIPQPLTSVLLDVRLTCTERLIADHHYLMKADEITDGAKKMISCVEYNNDGIEIWDPNGHIKYLNYSTADSIGYSRWEILGKEFSFLIDNQEIIPQMWATITGGKPWNGYIRTKHANGALVYFESSVSPVYDTQQKLIYYNCSKRDATQKRIDEEFRTQEQERTIETSRLRLSMMSHDIRTPMSGIIGMTDLLAETELHPQQRHYLDIIRASSNTLLNIINDLLDISKIEAGKLEIENREFDFRETVEDVCELMGERAQAKALSLMCFVHPTVPQNLIGDSSRLKQILNNLLGNSVKFTDNGEILVVCNVANVSEDIVALRIEVKDTGIGIKKEALPLLFKAFTQAEGSIARQYAGSGLGLAICKELANLAFNGDIGVESQYGVGSTFWTVLNFKLINPITTSMSVGVALSKSPIQMPQTQSSFANNHNHHHLLPIVNGNLNPSLHPHNQQQQQHHHDPMNITPSGNGTNEGTAAAIQQEDMVVMSMVPPLQNIDSLARECTISSENPPNFNGIRVLLIERNANQRNFLTQQMGVWNIFLDSTDDVNDAIVMCEHAIAMLRPYSFIIIDLATVGNDALLLAQKLTEQSKASGHMLQLILLVPLKMRSPQLEEEARKSGFGEIVTKPIRMSVLLDSLKSLSGLQRQKTIRSESIVSNPDSPHDKLEMRVLVVDDNMVNRQVAYKMLQSMGCNVDVVSSGMEALDRIEKVTYDMIFLDIMMPGMDGFQVTKEIRERELKRSNGTKHIPIIAMTANAFKEDEVKCINSGMDDYLSKPIKITEFRLLMSKWRQNIFLATQTK